MFPLFQKIKNKSSLEKPTEELSFTLNKRKNGVIDFGLFYCLLLLSPAQLFYDPIDCNPPLSSVHGIFQGRMVECVSFIFLKVLPDQGSYLHLLHWQANSLPLSHLGSTSVKMLSHFCHVQLFATTWTVAHQASLSMEFSRQEYWSGFPFPSPSVQTLSIKYA